MGPVEVPLIVAALNGFGTYGDTGVLMSGAGALGLLSFVLAIGIRHDSKFESEKG